MKICSLKPIQSRAVEKLKFNNYTGREFVKTCSLSLYEVGQLLNFAA